MKGRIEKEGGEDILVASFLKEVAGGGNGV